MVADPDSSLVEYFSSQEFARDMETALERARQTVERLEKAREVTFEMLHQPMTI